MSNALYDIRLRDADGRRVGGGEGQRDRICKAREDRTPFLAENKKKKRLPSIVLTVNDWAAGLNLNKRIYLQSENSAPLDPYLYGKSNPASTT